MQDIIWTPIAESDLDDIIFYIAHRDKRPETALQVFDDIRAAIKERVIKQIPGYKHPVAPKEWLYFQFKRWLVFYQPIATGIEVMRVIDGVRDLPKNL